MAQFSCAFRPPIKNEGGFSGPVCDFRSSATDQPRILEISGWVINNNGSAVGLGVGRPATGGVVKANSLALQPHDPNTPASSILVGVEWTTLPTVPAQFMRRGNAGGNVVGNQFRFVFDNGITIGTSSSLVLWLTGPNTTLAFPLLFDVNVVLDQ